MKDITKLQMGWEPTPAHMHKIDLSSFLQAKSIVEVDMIDAEDDDIVIEREVANAKDEVTFHKGKLSCNFVGMLQIEAATKVRIFREFLT